MKNYLLILIIFVFIPNCTLNKVINNHGVHFLEKKEKKLNINISNKNDILALLGPPSTKSTFEEDLWIYIERKTSSSRLLKLGKKDLIESNVLVLEINNKGLLAKKIFLTKDDIENIDFDQGLTTMSYTKSSFIYNFLSATRSKISDPLGKKKLKGKKN